MKTMNEWQKLVSQFHIATNSTVGEFPAIRDRELRTKLIMEEAQETVDAINNRDLIKAIDGLCDTIVVLVGTAVAFGIDLNPFFKEVCRSNLTKIGGEKREDGKVLKPSWFEPPNLEKVLNDQINYKFQKENE
jgi:predicted HAD superfamily Cof-like phosphohydrolase